MKKYLVITSILILISAIMFTIYNGGIFLDGVDKLTANIITIHIEIGFANFFISKFIYFLAVRNK